MSTSSSPSNQAAAGGTGGIDPSVPTFQPASFDAASDANRFASNEILWWDNGVWGRAGYAIPNSGGKNVSQNETLLAIVRFIGRELFNLMHRPDVKFSRPFNAEWLYDCNKMLALGIKRMGDRSVGWADKREGDVTHATNTPQSFTTWPVPYFGERIRQMDARLWCGQILILLSELMQHSDNDFDDNVTDFATSVVQEALRRIQKDMAMKYLGLTREAVEAPGWLGPADELFSEASYKPDKLFTSTEMIEERMPEQWWPTTNDLTPIAGLSYVVASVYGKRWPDAGPFYGDGGAHEAAWPAGGLGIVARPGSRPV